MSSEEEQSLKRDVGWYGSFCMGYADVGADIYVALGLVAFYAAGASLIAFAIASFTYICTGLAYAELASVYPYAGGAHIYAMKAFNDMVGFIAGWAVMLDYTIDIALFSLATAGYLSFFFPWMKTSTLKLTIMGYTLNIQYLGLIAAILVLALIFLNIIGIRESSLLNELLVSLDLIVEMLILILGIVLAFSIGRFLNQVSIFGAPSPFTNISYLWQGDFQLQNFIYGVTLAMTSFIGIESIAQAAEETRRPSRWIPRANKLSIISVLTFALGLSVVSIGTMPWEELASAHDPMAALASNIPLAGAYLAPIVALTGFAICYVSTNTGVIGVSRVVFSMGKFGLLPKWFYKVHRRFMTPYRTILVFGIIGVAMAILGELHLVADLYNFGALLSYIIVNTSLIILRNTEPEAYRAWKVPGDIRIKIGGRLITLPTVSLVGAISCLAIWLLVVGYHPAGRVFGTLWIVAGMIGFCIFRRRVHIPVFSNQMGKTIHPSGYIMNALVLVRTPEDEEMVVRSLKESIDKRFRLTLFNIIDPDELGVSIHRRKDYEQLRLSQKESFEELKSIAEKLRSEGFICDPRVEIGPYKTILTRELESDRNDAVVLIKRRMMRSDIEREREDAIQAVISKYPGKMMVARRMVD
ncbi:MAG: APC family permease [Candidatus Bathyarchaeia archaeon]